MTQTKFTEYCLHSISVDCMNSDVLTSDCMSLHLNLTKSKSFSELSKKVIIGDDGSFKADINLYGEPQSKSIDESVKTPHKHAELIKAWADGADIQWCDTKDTWRNIGHNTPAWDEDTSYRIKPDPKPDVVTFLVNFKDVGWKEKEYRLPSCESIKLIRDSETGKIKGAEVL